MNRIIIFFLFFSFFSFCSFCSFVSFANEKNPVYFLEKIIEESRPALVNKNDMFLQKTMEKYVDFEEMATWIVSKSIWLSTPVDKKKEFLFELQKLILKTYSKTVYYYVEADVSFLNPNIDEKFFENKKRIQINSIMKKNSKNVNISYRLIWRDDSWYVYDVLIEGISILKSLKMQYSDMIKNKGIDYTINKIKFALNND